MKKILLVVISLILCVNLFSQNQSVIIGVGQSENVEIFAQVEKYTMTCKKDLNVVFVCEQHRIIVIESLTERYKDPMTLISTLEKIFPNTDFFIKQSDYCLFGYITDSPDEYEQVIQFLNRIGVYVISSCKEEYLIYVILNTEYKDYMNLFAKIEKRFSGQCFYKSNENRISLYNKCRDQQIKIQLK